MKLEEFCGYLPYKVKVLTFYNDIRVLHGFAFNQLEVNAALHSGTSLMISEGSKLILRPLSDLARKIEHNGKKFVPIVELAKIHEQFNFVKSKAKGKNGIYGCIYEDPDGIETVFAYHTEPKSFGCHTTQDGMFHSVTNQHELFQKLHEWHFWLGDQSRFGQDIIDINTLKP